MSELLRCPFCQKKGFYYYGLLLHLRGPFVGPCDNFNIESCQKLDNEIYPIAEEEIGMDFSFNHGELKIGD